MAAPDAAVCLAERRLCTTSPSSEAAVVAPDALARKAAGSNPSNDSSRTPAVAATRTTSRASAA